MAFHINPGDVSRLGAEARRKIETMDDTQAPPAPAAPVVEPRVEKPAVEAAAVGKVRAASGWELRLAWGLLTVKRWSA